MLGLQKFKHRRTEEQVKKILSNFPNMGEKELLEEEFEGTVTTTHYGTIVSLFDGEREFGLLWNGNQAQDISALTYQAEIDGYIEHQSLVTKDEEEWKDFVKENWLNNIPTKAWNFIPGYLKDMLKI